MMSSNVGRFGRLTVGFLFVVILFFFAGCATIETGISAVTDMVLPQKVTFTVDAPADYPPSLNIRSIQVKRFTPRSRTGSRYGEQLADMIESGIASEGYLMVVQRNPDAVVEGDLNIGNIKKNSYTKSYKTKKGTYRTYYFTKKLTVSGVYSLIDRRAGRKVIGDSFRFEYDEDWHSSQSMAEAKAEADADESILQSLLEQISKTVVYSVTPHKETVTRRLEKGSDKSIRLGNKYLVKGRQEQAVSIWDQVAESTGDAHTKAAAFYNIGIVKEATQKYADAFVMFRKANNLWPERELYIEAMTRVEDAKRRRDVQVRQLRRLQ